MPKAKPGENFSDWTVVADTANRLKWLCQCVCSKRREVSFDNLIRGRSLGCGCSRLGRASVTHGLSRTPILGVWRTMMSRCYNPSNRSYKDYGARGIFAYEEWHDLENFIKDCGPHPGNGLTFDRVDNDKGYEPGNVRWATRAQQARNTRRNRVVEYEGRSMCVTDWAAELKVKPNDLFRRHRKSLSWVEALEDVIKNPPKRKGPYKTKKITA